MNMSMKIINVFSRLTQVVSFMLKLIERGDTRKWQNSSRNSVEESDVAETPQSSRHLDLNIACISDSMYLFL